MAPSSKTSSSRQGGGFGFTKLLTIVGVLVGIFTPIAYLLEQRLESFYIFKTDHLHDLAQRGIKHGGNDTRAIVDYIVSELHGLHPNHVNLDEEWIFSNAGGAMGAMYLIHASITEYIIIFGTTIGTEGHTGRHTADDFFHILTGEQWAYLPGGFEKEVYRPGDVHHLHRGTVKQYKMPEGCFALEYARGWIPLMMPFGLADSFFSTVDLPTVWRTAWVTGKQMVGNLMLGKL